eukprot:TRINITY_DN1650_c0_g1_i2.p2 TRINITY_DN1650_c0_g1~~TRINITY_DN1650_c0_g1_i2.p2  ORF type:complete len:193 (+),score=28.39 TRINITY_DN1650_c0_g1_i2:58-636(+)
MSLPRIDRPSRMEGRTKPARASLELTVEQSVVDDIVDKLPSQPESQLNCGLEILKRSFTQRVEELEAENAEVRKFGKQKMQEVVALEQKVASLEDSISLLVTRATQLESDNRSTLTERDMLQEKAANIAAHVKALMAFKKNCQAFLGSTDELPDMRSPTTDPSPDPPDLPNVPSRPHSRRGYSRQDSEEEDM